VEAEKIKLPQPPPIVAYTPPLQFLKPPVIVEV
jgi:hypothetical protein